MEKSKIDPSGIAYGASHPDEIVKDTSHGTGRDNCGILRPQITTFWGLRCATRGEEAIIYLKTRDILSRIKEKEAILASATPAGDRGYIQTPGRRAFGAAASCSGGR